VSTVDVGRPAPPEMRMVSWGAEAPLVAPEDAHPRNAAHDSTVSERMLNRRGLGDASDDMGR
jgi:hypothetical protein